MGRTRNHLTSPRHRSTGLVVGYGEGNGKAVLDRLIAGGLQGQLTRQRHNGFHQMTAMPAASAESNPAE